MKLVVQRVKSAEVFVNNRKSVGKIGEGLLVLVGVSGKDSNDEAEVLALKLSKLRVLKDKNSKMNLSANDKEAGILVVSQFTLYADTQKGNRPSFVKAAMPSKARKIYDHFVLFLKKEVKKVEGGEFGEYMNIKVSLDGPVTIILESTNDKKN